jgi:EAL domain-containing protein (putative c-di-GMP-specific phosphodiesterase class I)
MLRRREEAIVTSTNRIPEKWKKEGVYPGRYEFLRLLPHVRFVCQPIVRLRDRALVGYELLVRGPRGTVLMKPDGLFHQAQALDVLLETDFLVFVQALGCRPRGIRCFVNLFGSTVERFFQQVVEELERHDLRTIVLEVNERFPPSRWASLRDALDPLRERGLKVALDDVGAGFSNLDMVVDLRPDIVKIDRFFIENIFTSKESVERVEHIVQLAKKLGMDVIAEGVETEQQVALLEEKGVIFGQGHLFGRPEPLPL